MKKILYTTLLLVIAATIGGCQKDNDYSTGTISIKDSVLYIAKDNYGAELTTYFTHNNVDEVEIYTTPLGWDAEIFFDEDEEFGLVTIYAPAKYYSGMDYTGTIVIRGESPEGNSNYAYISVGMVDFIDLEATDQQANSMIVTEPNCLYLFNPNIRGEGVNSYMADAKVTDCVLLWRSANTPINGVRMYDNMIGFYTTPDSNDVDDDGDEEDIIPGNAVIAGLSESGVVVWSWHIWISNDTPSEVTFGSATFMDRNIGALGITNADYEETLETYGLYYQWGRKDPFIQPYYYNGSGAIDAFMYNSYGNSVKHAYYQSNAATGFLGYSAANPGIFIGGTDESKRDWLLPNYQNDELWGASSVTKSIYDPSPRGWRVPSASELAEIGTVTAAVANSNRDVTDNDNDDFSKIYGATFTDANSTENIFVAAGRRAYMNGSIQNYVPVDVDPTFRPWGGYYWSRDAANNDSDGCKLAKGLRFYLNDPDETDEGEASDVEDIVVETEIENYRAMGMQIRCVKY